MVNGKRKYRIGSTCFLQNLSAVLESKNQLSYSMKYTFFDFYYNKDVFISFKNEKEPSYFISKDNPVVIINRVDSFYVDEVESYKESQHKNLVEIKVHNNMNTNDKIVKLVQENGAVLFNCDSYYLKPLNNPNSNEKIEHQSAHKSMLFDMNIENNTCHVVDRYNNFDDNITIDNFWESCHSEYIPKEDIDKLGTIQFNTDERSEKNRLFELLYDKLVNIEDESTVINGKKYYKNAKAIESLIADFDMICLELEKQKGKYAPLFLNQLFESFTEDVSGFTEIFDYANHLIFNDNAKEMLLELKNLSEMWLSIRPLSVMCYIMGKNLSSYSERIKTLLAEILVQEKIVISKLYELRCNMYTKSISIS